jgi:hypothetical protein
MPRINLTAAAMQALRGFAGGRLADTSRIRPNGTYDVPLSEATVARLEAHRNAGETLSDVVVRMAWLTGVDQ